MSKSIRKYGILVLVAMMVMTSCMDKNARKNNYPTPNVNFVLPVGDVYTIDTLWYMWQHEETHKFTQDASVYGIVTCDEASGNLYKASFIQDGDRAIELYMKSTSGLRIGDSIRVYLKGATLSEYSGTPQIQDLDPKNITILANNKDILPLMIKTTEITSNHNCRLVCFDNVEFPADVRDSTWAQDKAYGQYTLNQYDDNCTLIDNKVIVRTSNYASFAKNKLPQGKGMIIGILTYYSGNGGTWQFTVRTMREVVMTNEPCEESIIAPAGSGTQADPYNISAGIVHQGEEGQWIRGYIVGAANVPFSGTITTNNDIAWGPTFTNDNNVYSLILADKEDENDINKCVVVYMPANAASGIQQNVNLLEHPDNWHKIIKVKGNLKAVMGKSGMRNTNEYELN